MDDLEEVKTDATDTGTPSQEADSPEVKPEESQVEEELTNEQIDEQVKELKEQAKNSEDPKEKRHLEQYAGRLQQISKAREKAEQAESIARDKESRIAQLERLEIEDVYNKAINDEY